MQLVTYRTFGAAAFPFTVTAADLTGLAVVLSSLIAQSVPVDRGGAGGHG